MITTTTLSSLLFSLTSGALFGILYGLLFIAQKRLLFAQVATDSTQKVKAVKRKSIALLLIRLIFLVGSWYYLLRSTKIVPILVLASFLIAFWGMVLKKKV